MTTRYYAQVRGNDTIAQPTPLAAETLEDAKREAWAAYGDGFRHHWLDICEAIDVDGEIMAGRTLLSRRLTDRAWRTEV